MFVRGFVNYFSVIEIKLWLLFCTWRKVALLRLPVLIYRLCSEIRMFKLRPVSHM